MDSNRTASGPAFAKSEQLDKVNMVRPDKVPILARAQQTDEQELVRPYRRCPFNY
jgi:hypothetical protein